jgi:hypothetical protein
MSAIPPEEQPDPNDPSKTPPGPDGETNEDEDGGAPDEGANPPLPAG